MTRLPLSAGPRLLPLFLAAVPTAALADAPGEPVPVAAVPAYAVAPPAYAPPSSYGAPGYAPLAAPADEPAPAAEAVGIARRVREDRVAERSYLAPTALVAPAGTTTLTIQAPIAPGAGFRVDRSFGDRLSLGAGVVAILDEDNLYGIGNLHAKYQLVRGRRAALAVTASMYNFPAEMDDVDEEDPNLIIPGAVLSLCTSDDCRTLVSADVQALTNVSDESLPIIGGVALASGVRRQLIAELHTTTIEDDRVWFGFIGGRFLGRKLALDAGLGFGAVEQQVDFADCIDVCVDTGSSTDLDWAPYPFIAISSRL